MKIPILSRLFKSRADPKNTFWQNAQAFFFGSATSGKTVNENTAMTTSAVYACVRILSETIASLPLHVYRRTEGCKEKAMDHGLYCLLHDEPNPEMTMENILVKNAQDLTSKARPIPSPALPNRTWKDTIGENGGFRPIPPAAWPGDRG